MTTIHVGDCREVLGTMEAASFDACVCDPPYDLTGKSRNGSPCANNPGTPFGRHNLQPAGGFMGHKWDATGVAFDPATWEAVYRVLRPGAYLVAFGGARTWHRMATAIEDAGFEIKDCLCWLYGTGMPKHTSLLKPAWEPVVLAKKRGQGSINRDACRVGDTELSAHGGGKNVAGRIYGNGNGIPAIERGSNPHIGRVPANVLLDEIAAGMLDEQTGILTSNSGKPFRRNVGNQYSGGFRGNQNVDGFYGDTGGASRFFYVAKADDAERTKGLPLGMENDHPTVKPVSLVQWLVRLVASPGQTVVDPFMGSGTTGIACDREGIGFVGIDLSEHYAEIARYRITGDAPLFAHLLTGD